MILYEDHYLRGRAGRRDHGPVPARGCRPAGECREITDVFGAIKAVDMALKQVRPGDLLLLQADVIDETVNFMRGYLQVARRERRNQRDRRLAGLAGGGRLRRGCGVH